MIEEIQEHFENEYPREGCGIVGVVKGKKRWFPCRNIAENDDDFVMSSEDYFNVVKHCDILAIVHSHPNSSNEASKSDIDYCNALGVPYWIFSYPDMDLNVINPEVLKSPLIGREYKFGVQDCFEAIRDYLKSKGVTIPPRAPFEDNWWENDLNYFSQDIIKKWGGVQVDTPQKNDVLIFQVKADVPDHCGVYLGNDIFFHHAENRLSCREQLNPFWGKYLVGIYRYES